MRVPGSIQFAWGAGVLFLLSCSSEVGDLRTVPPPAQLGEMDAVVQRLYHERRDAVESARGAGSSELALRYGDLGNWYQVYRLDEGAEAAYRIAARLDPADPRWAYYLGILLAGTERVAEAREYFARVLESWPEDVASMVRLAEIEGAAGRLESASSLLEAALELEPGCVRAQVALGKLEMEHGSISRAIELLEAAVVAQPDALRVRHSLGLAYRKTGQLERAKRVLAETEQGSMQGEVLKMTDPLFNSMKAAEVGLRVSMKKGRYAEAREHYSTALRHYRAAAAANAGAQEPRLGVATMLSRLGRYPEAFAEYTALLERFPDNYRAHYGLAGVHSIQREPEAAMRHLRRALEYHSSFFAARRALANVLMATGEHEEALEHLLAAGLLRPEDARIPRDVSLTLIRLGRYEEAREALEQAQVLGSRDLSLSLARLLAASPDRSLRDGDRALEISSAAFDASPGLDAAEVVVLALAETGRLEAAAAGQRYLIRTVKASGRHDLVGEMEERLQDLLDGKAGIRPISELKSLDSVFVEPSGFAGFLPPETGP